MLRDKVRNFKPIDDQGEYGYRVLKHPFPQRGSIHHGMNSLELVNGFCFWEKEGLAFFDLAQTRWGIDTTSPNPAVLQLLNGGWKVTG